MQKKDDTKLPAELQKITELETEVNKALEQVSALEKDLSATKERELRLIADTQNMRRRLDEEKGRLLFDGSKNILDAILPGLDNFLRAMETLPAELKGNAWVEGILAIEKHMYELLQKAGVEEITATSVALDPALHEAVMVDAEGEEGKVTKILQRGYLFQGKVLRPAQVAVGQKANA